MNLKNTETSRNLGNIDIDVLPVGVVIIDASSRKIVDLNIFAQELIGAEKADIIGQNCQKFICPTEKGICPVLDLGEDICNSECQLLTNSGKLIPIIKTVRKSTVDGHTLLYEVIQDIADTANHRQQLKALVKQRTMELTETNDRLVKEIKSHEYTEMQLNELFSKYSIFFDNCNDGLTLIDFSRPSLPGNYLEVNDSFCRMVNYSREELLQMAPLDLTVPEMRNYALKQSDLFLKAEEEMLLFENIYVTKDGRRINCEINARATHLVDKRVVVAVYRDISAHKLLEQSLRESYKRERKAHSEIEDQLKKRSHFTRALVHELKTPLTPVLASSEYLVSKLTDDSMLKYAENMRIGAINLSNRIEELLNIAKGEVGQLKINPVYDDVRKVIKESVDYLTPQAQKMRKSITLKLTQDLPMTIFDKQLISQVMLNLLNNSLKFSRADSDILVEAKRVRDEIKISVKDQGIGMPKGKRQGIFTPYYRISTKRDRHGGLGLGLALSKMIVELHEGRIWFTSKYGQGSTFYFTLPIRSKLKA